MGKALSIAAIEGVDHCDVIIVIGPQTRLGSQALINYVRLVLSSCGRCKKVQ